MNLITLHRSLSRAVVSPLSLALLTVVFASSSGRALTIQQQVDNAIALGAGSVVLTQGTYTVATGSALSLSAQNNFTVYAAGVHIVMGSYVSAISLAKCGAISILGGSVSNPTTIDYNPLPFVEGTVNSVVVETSPKDIKMNLTLDTATPWPAAVASELGTPCLNIHRTAVIDPATNGLKPGSAAHEVYEIDGETDGTYTVYLDHGNPVSDTLAVNDRVAFPVMASFPGGSQTHTISLAECGGCVFNGLILYAAPTMAVYDLDAGSYPGASGANSFIAIQVIPGSGRVRSSNADGIHCVSPAEGPTIRNCVLDKTGDDAIIVHGNLAQATATVSSSTTCTIQSRTPIGNFGPFQAGHTIKLFAPDGAGAFGNQSPTVLSATVSVGPQYVSGSAGTGGCSPVAGTPYVYTLTFSAPVTIYANTWLQDQNAAGANFLVKENTITNGLGRGIYAMGDDGLIYGNTINCIGLAGILVEPSVQPTDVFQDFGNFADGMTISGNSISETLWLRALRGNNAAGAISVLASDPTWGVWGQSNLTITGNTLTSCVGVQILLQGVSPSTVIGNKFYYPGVNNVSPSTGSLLGNSAFSVVDPGYTTCNALVWIGNVDVTFTGNSIYSAGTGANGLSLYDYDGCIGSPTSPPAPVTVTLTNDLAHAFQWH